MAHICFCLWRYQDRHEHDDGSGPAADDAATADAADDAHEHDAGTPLSLMDGDMVLTRVGQSR